MESPDAAHNALTIELNRRAIANYRVSDEPYDCDGNGIADSIDIARDLDLDLNGNCILDSCEVRLYVDGDAPEAGDGFAWSEARGDLRSALENASMRCSNITEVWVAEQTYVPDQNTGDPELAFTIADRCGLSVYGGFEGTETSLDQRDLEHHATILSGEIDDSTSYYVVTVWNAHDILIDGFGITGGGAFGTHGHQDGGGLLVGLSKALFRNLTIHDNAANRLGGGAVIFDVYEPDEITFENCRFEGNSAGDTKTGYGGGLDVRNAPLILSNCLMSNNSANNGGGMSISDSGNIVVTNCTFSGNDASNGSALAFDSFQQQFPSNLSMSNCILWDGGGEVWNNDNSVIDVVYSDVQGGWPGVGNIDLDPLFVDADGPDDGPETWENNDYRLQADSPCIDAADNEAVPPDNADRDGDGDTDEPMPFDLDGNPRFVDDPDTDDCPQAPGTCGDAPVVDMGAYEFQLCLEDLDGDGEVGPFDLALVLGFWGPCPEPCTPEAT